MDDTQFFRAVDATQSNLIPAMERRGLGGGVSFTT
jgi:hypothetical protein